MTSILEDFEILKKATPIRFVAGAYKGKSGWIDPTRVSTDRRTPVIVNVPKKGGMYQTNVENGNWREITTDEPMTLAEAVFLVPDVEAKVVDACRTIVKFDVCKDEEGIEEVKELFGEELEKAQDWQERKGDKAVWRKATNWKNRAAQAQEHQLGRIVDA